MALALDGHGHSTGLSTVTLTTTNATDVIVVFVLRNGGGHIAGITDNSGVTAAWQSRVQMAAVTDGIEEWFTTSTGILTGATITFTWTGGTPGFVTIDAFGVSGANTSSPFDGSPVSSSANPSDPLTISTTHANTMVIAGFRESGASSPTAGAGFTTISGADFQLSEYQIFNSIQTNLSVTQSPSGGSNGGIADAIVAASSAVVFRKTFSPIGGRVGSRQLHSRWQRSGRGGLLLRNPLILPEAA